MPQDSLNLVLQTFIDHNWWCVGLHAIFLIGCEECHMVNVVDSLKGFPVAAAGEVQVVGSLPYSLGDGKWSKKPVLQFFRALKSHIPSTQQFFITNFVINSMSLLVSVLLLSSLHAAQGGSCCVAYLYPIRHTLLCCLNILHTIQTVDG